MVWNVFGNPNLSDPFHEATKTLLDGLSSPAESKGGLPFALDVEARMAALNRTGAFDKIEHRAEAWSLSLDTAQTIALYATYSNINVRPDREDILSELGRIATNEFNGLVTRNMITEGVPNTFGRAAILGCKFECAPLPFPVCGLLQTFHLLPYKYIFCGATGMEVLMFPLELLRLAKTSVVASSKRDIFKEFSSV
jgi:hypothetical protein